jgi:type IX secretion system PorP/SprF family membrane protein
MKIAAPFKLKQSFFTLMAILVVFSATAQQRPQFTQFMYNSLAINPAYAGADEVLSLTFVNRNQWSGVENAPSTQSFAAHTLIKNKNIGIGLTILNDKIGVHKNLTALTNYAYHINLSERTSFSMGLQAGVTNLKSDYASLLGNSNDPKLTRSINETVFGFGAGVYFKSPRFQLGLSAPDLLSKVVRVNDTLSINIRRINLLAVSRYRFTLSESFEMEPGVMVKYFPDLPVSLDLNLNFIYRKVITAGLSYRGNESIDFLLRLQITPQLQFGYAYDYPIKYAAELSSASNELMINYQFHKIKKGAASLR